jgi:hypothetical protein
MVYEATYGALIMFSKAVNATKLKSWKNVANPNTADTMISNHAFSNSGGEMNKGAVTLINNADTTVYTTMPAIPISWINLMP